MSAADSPVRDVAVHSHRSLHPFFTPTYVRFSPLSPTQSSSSSTAPPNLNAASPSPTAEWSSRRHRKARYAAKSARTHYLPSPSSHAAPEEEGRARTPIRNEIQARVKSEETHLKPQLTSDITFWLAVTFTFGSVMWVINGFLVWFPILRPQLDTTAFSYTAAATAFIGGSVFEIGSYMMVVEALDRGRETAFGTALGQLLHHHRRPSAKSDMSLLSPSRSGLDRRASSQSTGRTVADRPAQKGKSDGKGSGWVWWGRPMWHDIGYMAALIQLFAATVFWISTLTGLPGVIKNFFSDTDSPSLAIVDVFFWTPQVIGGSGFIISSTLLMLEVQESWWRPKPLDVGWHVAFWNLIGSLGFTLCGALGYPSKSTKCEYQSALSTFWGSWAFLIGSGFQLVEATWREKPEKGSQGSDEKNT